MSDAQKPLWETLVEIGAKVPAEEWDKLASCGNPAHAALLKRAAALLAVYDKWPDADFKWANQEFSDLREALRG